MNPIEAGLMEAFGPILIGAILGWTAYYWTYHFGKKR